MTQELVLLKYGNCLYKVAAIKNFLHPIFSGVLLPQFLVRVGNCPRKHFFFLKQKAFIAGLT